MKNLIVVAMLMCNSAIAQIQITKVVFSPVFINYIQPQRYIDSQFVFADFRDSTYKPLVIITYKGDSVITKLRCDSMTAIKLLFESYRRHRLTTNK